MQRGSLGTLATAERAERLVDFLALSYEPMLVWRLDGTIEFWNAGAEQLYGYTSQEAIRRSSHVFLQTKFPTDFIALRARLRDDRQWSGELTRVCKDGREVVIDSRMQLFEDEVVLEVNRNVTERRQIEAVLRESEERSNWLAAIVESSDDVIVSKNLDGIITSWNRGAERVFGYSAAEAVGQPITIVIPPDRLDEERTILTRIRRGERIDHFETIRQHKHGNLIHVSLSVSPVKDGSGRIVGASKIARDITEQKRAQELIATLAREAEHRSKNLLANVQAAVNLSRADTPDELKQAIAGRIQALANVHSLFAETRWIGAELATVATQELAPYAAQNPTRVRIDGQPVLLEPNTAQAIAITLHELATNAAKYGSLSQPRGQIALTWQHDADGQLRLRWAESGGPAVQPPTRQGFGSRIVGRLIEQLKGEARFDWRPEGLVCEIVLKA